MDILFQKSSMMMDEYKHDLDYHDDHNLQLLDEQLNDILLLQVLIQKNHLQLSINYFSFRFHTR